MSDLYERLRAWLDQWERDVPQPEPLLAMARAVVELHEPEGCNWSECSSPTTHFTCACCGQCVNWPCSTIRAVARSLDVEIPE